MNENNFSDLVIAYWSYHSYPIETVNDHILNLFKNRYQAENFAYYFKIGKNEDTSGYLEPVYKAIYTDMKEYPALKQQLKNFTDSLDIKHYPQLDEKVFTEIVHSYFIPENMDVMDMGDDNKTPKYEAKEVFDEAVTAYFRKIYPIPKVVNIIQENKESDYFLRELEELLPLSADYYCDEGPMVHRHVILNSYGNLFLIASRLLNFNDIILYKFCDRVIKVIEKYISDHSFVFGMRRKTLKRSTTLKRSKRRSRRKSGPRRKSRNAKRKSR